MDGYAPEYVTHNLPLLVISGLGPTPSNSLETSRGWEAGAQVTSEVPPVQSEDALVLLKHFEASDGGNLAWNSREHNGRNKFRVKVTGRGYTLPPRHIQIPVRSSKGSPGSSPTPRSILHSPLSPLSPGSRVFPDGLIDPRWIQKHQDLVPSAFLSFYTFSANPTLSSVHDNQLKTDINHTKTILSQSGYKSRLIVILLSELKVQAEVEERLANIRKATGLDPKSSLFFLPPQSSQVELQAFVDTVLSTIYPLCIEYYRDLSKHSRRKRNRGIVPPPTAPPTSGTSQTLSSQGWNVRYDFKLGVFAEFRQEIDVALRSYESGYEGLLGPDVLETIASWSPRWNEARLLADVFSIRVLRCLFWNGNTTAAVRRWKLHRDRIRDFVDRRGKGSSTYGWEAWEARWATVMAEMIRRVDITDFGLSDSPMYLPPEKSIAIGERIQPFEQLHHPGYWFRLASKHVNARRALALAIPEEDRSPPGESPASQIASKSYTYDTYLCPEPHEENPLPRYGKGVDHSLLIIELLTKAILEFQERGQTRLVQELYLQSANESIRREAWVNALRLLRPLWQKMSYRREGFWNVVEEIGWALRKVAAKVGDGGTVVAVDWELLNRSFKCQPNWHYDLMKSLEGLETIKAKPAIVLHDQEVHSFISGSYAFEHLEGKVGELCASQLVINSFALPKSAPVTITELLIDFEGSMKPIVMRHKAKDGLKDVTFNRVSLTEGFDTYSRTSSTRPTEDGRPTLFGEEDLTFAPGQTRIFEFSSILREAGNAKALSATFRIASDLFDLDYVLSFAQSSVADIWWGNHSKKKRLLRANAYSIVVLPKPPKMELRFHDFQEQYYTNEQINLRVEVINGEEEDSITSLDLRVMGADAPLAKLMLVNAPGVTTGDRQPSETGSQVDLGRIASAASTVVEVILSPVNLPALYDLTLKASYNLASDLETPVSRTMSIQLPVISPFEANYDFSPRIHPDPWPSFFSHDELGDVGMGREQALKACGLSQKWCLTTRYASFATEDLVIEDVDVEVLGVNGGIQCFTKKVAAIADGGIRMGPKSIEEAQFFAFTQKNSLDDRGTATLDVSLAIRWRRAAGGAAVNTTVLPVPRLLVSSSEPRVLASISYPMIVPSMIHFDVTIENPSNHFLTFGLSMEPSEDFAFSGIKQSTLQLVPLSRRTIRFRLLPSVRGEWIGPIRCVIRDRYFQKVLKVAPTEGMKIDKEGIIIWVPPEEES